MKAFKNDGDSPTWVSGRMILPGATELIDVVEDAVADVLPEVVEAKFDPLPALLEKAVKEIVPALLDLSDDDLVALEDLEQAGKNRKGLLAEVLTERLKRAAGPTAALATALEVPAVPPEVAEDEQGTVNRDAEPGEAGGA